MCACDTANHEDQLKLNHKEIVGPLLNNWFASGTALDDLCKPFTKVVRELKADPPTLIGKK